VIPPTSEEASSRVSRACSPEAFRKARMRLTPLGTIAVRFPFPVSPPDRRPRFLRRRSAQTPGRSSRDRPPLRSARSERGRDAAGNACNYGRNAGIPSRVRAGIRGVPQGRRAANAAGLPRHRPPVPHRARRRRNLPEYRVCRRRRRRRNSCRRRSSRRVRFSGGPESGFRSGGS